MSTKTKERNSKDTYRQCVMRLVPGQDQGVGSDAKPGIRGLTEYVAWLPSQLVKVGKHVLIDSKPGRWLIVDAGEKRPAYIVEAYAEHGRTGLPDGSGPSTPMRDTGKKKKGKG